MVASMGVIRLMIQPRITTEILAMLEPVELTQRWIATHKLLVTLRILVVNRD